MSKKYPQTPEQRKIYKTRWKAKRKALDIKDPKPLKKIGFISESRLRGRCCRKCGEPCDGNSYYYCYDHAHSRDRYQVFEINGEAA